MGSEMKFDLNGTPQVANSPLSVRELLTMAGASTAEFCIEVVGGAVFCAPDHLVTIQDGDKLELKRRSPAAPVDVHYKVNGEEQITRINRVSLETILREAGAAATIDINDLRSYYLENIADGSKHQNLDDLITIKDGEEFLAVHVGATPVA